MRFILFALVGIVMACGNGSQGDYKIIDDLPFQKAKDEKAYADIILKSIRTNRDLPIWQEFENKTVIDKDSLHLIVGMYSTAISGRSDWDFIDVYKDSDKKDISQGFDYAWLDPSGRLGLQIRVIPVAVKKGFKLKLIEFRSRLDVMESRAFPGGPISDYVKLDYDWDANLERKLKEDQN